MKFCVSYIKSTFTEEEKTFFSITAPDTNSPDFISWKSSLVTISLTVEKRVMKFLEIHRQVIEKGSKKECDPKAKKRKRSWSPNVTSCYKRLKLLQSNNII